MSLKLIESRAVNSDVDIDGSSATFVNLAVFNNVNIPVGGLALLHFDIPVDTSVATDTVGYRVQVDAVDVNITPRLIDIGFVNQANNVNATFSGILVDVNGGPIEAGIKASIAIQGNRSSGSGTVTFIVVDASLLIFGPSDEGASNAFGPQESSAAPMGAGGNPLQQRGNPYPGTSQPYR